MLEYTVHLADESSTFDLLFSINTFIEWTHFICMFVIQFLHAVLFDIFPFIMFIVLLVLQSVGLFLGIVSMDIRKGMTQATIYIMVTMLLGMQHESINWGAHPKTKFKTAA